MTKEQILDAIIDNHPFQGLGEEEYKIALQAMEKYADQAILNELESLLVSMNNAHPEYAQEIIREQISIRKHGI
jgi:hypothetical protein